MYFKLGFNYIKKHISRSIAIFSSMVICIALIIGISSLFESEKQANIEMIKYELGNYHIIVKDLDIGKLNKLKNNKNIDNIGLERHYASSSDKKKIFNIAESDGNNLKLQNTKILKGRMAYKHNEIVLEPWVIESLGLTSKLGQKICFDLIENNGITKTEEFTLVGIIKDRVNNKSQGIREIIIPIDKESHKPVDYYVEFKENSDISKNIDLLKKQLNLKKDNVGINSDLIESVSNNIITNNNLLTIIAVISIFACLIVYSIFNISTLQRISDYGILKSIGAEKLQIFKIILSELFFMFITSLPFGIVIGIGGAYLFSFSPQGLLSEGVNINKIFISKESIYLSIILMFITVLIISISQVTKINRLSSIEAITMNNNKKVNNKSFYNLGKKLPMIKFISLKNILRDKRSLLITIISMAIGSTIFISSNFSANLKNTNSMLQVKSDSGLTSDFKIDISSIDFKDGISTKQINKIKKINGVSSVESFRYYPFSMNISGDKVAFPHYYDFLKQYKSTEKFRGIFTKNNDHKSYDMKGDLYSYSDVSLNKLKPYLVDGSINITEMKKENKAIIKIDRDGRGNPVFNLKVGDKIKIRCPKDTVVDENDIKFPSNIEYIEKEYTISGIVKESTEQNGFSFGGYFEVILSNEMFKKSIGIDNYNTVTINKKDKYDSIKINKEINNITKDTVGVVLRDLSLEVEELNNYNYSKAALINGITVILFLVSLFNILNNISYNLISRSTEFSVIRAIGLSEKGYKNMIVFEGIIYGTISNLLFIFLSIITQRIIFMRLESVLISPRFDINFRLYIILIIINMIVGILATYIPASKLKNNSIVSSINNTV